MGYSGTLHLSELVLDNIVGATEVFIGCCIDIPNPDREERNSSVVIR